VYGIGRRIGNISDYDVRYVSISTVENMPPSSTYHSLADYHMEEYYGEGWDRNYVVVAATDTTTFEKCKHAVVVRPTAPSPMFIPYSRQGLIPPRLPGALKKEE